MNNWNLVKNGNYAEAVAGFSEELRERPSTGVFNNRGIAHLHLGDFDAALADFRSADSISSATSKTVCDGDLCGVALWMAGREQEALATWTEGVEASLAGLVRYGDAAGGVTVGNLLMFGGIRTGCENTVRLAARLLKKRLRNKQARAWPGPVSAYLLGTLAESDMLAAVTDTAILREREMCQARFYMGVRAWSAGDRTAYLQAMREARDFGSISKLGAEYCLALHEERRLPSTPA